MHFLLKLVCARDHRTSPRQTEWDFRDLHAGKYTYTILPTWPQLHSRFDACKTTRNPDHARMHPGTPCRKASTRSHSVHLGAEMLRNVSLRYSSMLWGPGDTPPPLCSGWGCGRKAVHCLQPWRYLHPLPFPPLRMPTCPIACGQCLSSMWARAHSNVHARSASTQRAHTNTQAQTHGRPARTHGWSGRRGISEVQRPQTGATMEGKQVEEEACTHSPGWREGGRVNMGGGQQSA